MDLGMDPIHRFILGVYLSRHRNMFVAEAFLRSLVEKYGSDGYLERIVKETLVGSLVKKYGIRCTAMEPVPRSVQGLRPGA